MKIHPQIISQKGAPAFVVLPYDEYINILKSLEDIEDIQAIEASKIDPHERFPLEIIEKIASGENPIKIYREYRRISQAELAEKVEVSRQYISQIENNERVGTAKLLKKIAKILTVDLDDITS